MFGLFIVLSTLTSIKADLPLFIVGGRCPPVSGVTNFDANQYIGEWFQLSSLPFIFVNSADRCILANYTSLPNGNIGVDNSGISHWTGIRSGAKGEAALIDGNTKGELNVQFYVSPSTTAEPNYFILGTDYVEYTYVWSCRNMYFGYIPQLWILNRQPKRSATYIMQQEQAAIDILKSFGYKDGVKVESNMITTSQENCDYTD